MKEEDHAILEVFNQNDLYFYLLIKRDETTCNLLLYDCYKYNKVENIEKYISF